jgi:hypothetical protein
MVEDLRSSERDAVLRFLLHYMPMETRRKLMAEMPVAYTKLFPTAKEATIRKVIGAIRPDIAVLYEDNQEEIDRAIAQHEQSIFENPDPFYGS